MTPFERADLLRSKARLLEARANRLREQVLLRANDASKQSALDRFITEEKEARSDYLNAKALRLYGKARVLEAGVQE